MRVACKIDRTVVKEFIQKDKTITCPLKGDYYALIEDGKVLSALCVTDQREKLGYYRVQGMRTSVENRRKGYSTELLKFALSKYNGLIHADSFVSSVGIFEKLGFRQVNVKQVGSHVEYQMEKEN